MEARQEGRAPADLLNAAVLSSNLAGSTAEAVDRILISTEEAVASIKARTEQQVRQIAADLEAQALQEALERRACLERVRRELADRAAALGAAYEAINRQLWAVDAALADFAAVPSASAGGVGLDRHHGPPAEVTLRERRQIGIPYDEAVASVPAIALEQVVSSTAVRSRRRWWAPWQREAA
jgi:hypothetical protein